MEVVRAGLADEVDLVGAEAVLGRVGGGLFLELLDGVDRQDRGRRAERGIDVGRAVDHEVVRRRPRSHDADRVAGALAHVALLAVGLDGARAQEQQLEEVAAIQRQLGDLLFGDGLADAGAAGVEGDGVRLDFDRLGDVARLELQIDALDLIDVELDVGAQRDLEACLLGGDNIVADGQQRHDVVSLVVGRRRCASGRSPGW